MSKLADNVAEAFRLCVEQQVRLDAIASLEQGDWVAFGKYKRTVRVLARGGPPKELERALKRWAPRKESK